MRLAHELVHLRVRGHVHDEIDLGILDAVDPARERRVVAGEVLQQRRERVAVHAFGRLSTPNTSWPSASRRRARFVPIWPDEPVTRMRMRLILPSVMALTATERVLPAAERGRGRALDQHVDELARLRRRR